MNIRFYNAKILTMEQDMSIQQGELWVQGERILYMGAGKDAPQPPVWEREVDVTGNLLMPGFKNAHTHSGMTLLRSYADDLPLLDWLNEQVFPVEAKMTAEDIYHLTKLAVMEYVMGGITAIFDMYLTPESIAAATEECGMRCVQVSGLNNFSQSLSMMEKLYEKLNHGNPLTSYQMGIHAEYTCDEKLLSQVSELLHQYRAPFFTHNSESRREVEQCVARTGMTPTAYMDSLGLFDFGGGCYHCVHMTDEDISILKRRGVSVVTNPASNAKLASGIAPVGKFLQAGLNVGIGTDGPASNNSLDMFREMYLATVLAKLKEDDAAAMDAERVLYMATAGGAKAMGLTDCDMLCAGKYADIILIDLKQPNMQPQNHITKNLVYSGGRQNVKLTMVNGRILYEDGQYFLGVKPDEVYAQAQAIIDRLRA